MDELQRARQRKENRKRNRRGAVTNEQVVAYAAKDCADCGGSGQSGEDVCDCAARRFQSLHADLLVIGAGGGLEWK